MADPASDDAEPPPFADLRWPTTVMDAGIGGARGRREFRGTGRYGTPRAKACTNALPSCSGEGEREGAT
jgi:hypothetical protein